jgi:tripartite ATP-independent transporter DctP family solute receptor
MKKMFKMVMLLLAATMLFVSCGKKEEATADGGEKKVVIKLSTIFKPEELLTKELIKVTDKIRERSNGSVDIQVYHSGQLPVYKANLEQVASGSNWIAVEDPSYLGDYVPDFAALVGPMLYNSYDEYEAMVKTDFVKGLEKQAEEQGVKVLALDYLFGFRNMITNKEIKTPADLKGLKIRVPASPLWMKTLSAMGANPSPISFTETYAAIQQGVVDGLEGSIETMYSTKMYEVTKNMSVTKHFLGTAGVYISPILWEKLTENQRTIIAEEFTAGAKENNTILRKTDVEARAKLEEAGVKFNDVDFDAFNEATAGVFTEFTKWTPGIHDTIMAELKKIREKK